MSGCNVSNSNLQGANLSNIIEMCYGSNVIFIDAKFNGSTIDQCYFPHSDFTNSVMRDVNLCQVTLSDCNLRGCDFTNAKLQEVNFTNSDLENAIFKNAKLKWTSFETAKNKNIATSHQTKKPQRRKQ
jgi:uncharacterized protein YjbI with pentapeptide repeats